MAMKQFLSHRVVAVLFLVAFLALSAGAHETLVQQPTLLTDDDILALVKAGLSADVVVAKIKASGCHFDTSLSKLKDLKEAGVPDSVILAMVEASDAQAAAIVSPPSDKPPTDPVPLSAEILAERANRDANCPKCKFLLISNVDSKTGAVTDDWLSKNQLEFLKHRKEQVKDGKVPMRFFLTKHRENADYILFWTAAQGFRPYVTYVPHTETSNANVSGTYNTSGTNGTDYGNFNGTVQVTRTYYQAQTNQWAFVDVVVTVYARSGAKVYESWHRGNFRWSKPDKDCLDDAFKYLIGLNP
jgi:hypothetical protein